MNERDGLGDDLVPDYISACQGGRLLRLALVLHRRQPGPAAQGKQPELKDKVIVPDVLCSHSALDLCFYDGGNFPRSTRRHLRRRPRLLEQKRRTGYKIIRVPMENGKARGDYEDFLTGFVTRKGRCGAARSGSRWRRTAASSSPRMATRPSGG